MRDLPDPGFAGDDGAAPAEVVAALRAYGADPDVGHAATLEVLQHARLLVPVVAVLGKAEEAGDGRGSGEDDGKAGDKTADMATVLIEGRDGRTALLAFTGVETLRRWDSEARPVPVTAARAAEAALQDGAAAVVVDVAGPVMFVVDGPDLLELAQGSVLVRVDGGSAVSGRYGWATPGR